MTTTTTAPRAEELQALTEEMNAWMEDTGRKRFPRAKQDELLEMGAKRCSRCTEVRRISEFPSDRTQADGLRSRCRPCHNGACAEYNREYMRERRTDPEYRQREREQKREYHRTMYTSDELYRLRHQLNDGYRRAVEAGNPADWVTAEELLTYWEALGIDPLVCVYTGDQLTPQDRSLDHCTPISRGGSHRVENIVPCTFEVNQAIGNRTFLEFMADRATEQDPEDLPEIVKQALAPEAPSRIRRTVTVGEVTSSV